eukprot:1156892-Pelagomonas_calceolata.AAC.5
MASPQFHASLLHCEHSPQSTQGCPTITAGSALFLNQPQAPQGLTASSCYTAPATLQHLCVAPAVSHQPHCNSYSALAVIHQLECTSYCALAIMHQLQCTS